MIRPSDPTSTKLQKANKYATKSLDVHDKSSNWGPMSGFVPADHFFNKKTGQTLNGDNDQPGFKVSTEHHSVDALTWDTKLSDANLFLTAELFEDVTSSNTRVPCPKISDQSKCPIKTSTCVSSKRPATLGKNPCVVFCLTPDSKEEYYDVTYFKHEDSDSTTWPKRWGSEPSTNCAGPNLRESDGAKDDMVNADASFIPVKVHAYDGSPVTGDCDLWGIFPRLRSIDNLVRNKVEPKIGVGLPISFPGLNSDNVGSGVHEMSTSEALVTSIAVALIHYKKSVAGGLSTATDVEYHLIDMLNQAILNADNELEEDCPPITRGNRATYPSHCTTRPIFNHGVELKNLHFAQEIDKSLVFITPGKGTMVVSKDDVPKQIGELSKHGYAISFNARWSMDDPKLNGQSLIKKRRHSTDEQMEAWNRKIDELHSFYESVVCT